MKKNTITDQPTEIFLNSNQLKIIDLLSELDPDKIKKNNFLKKEEAAVARFFRWVDESILDRTSRLWMYVLEILGIVSIGIIINKILFGLDLISHSKSTLQLDQAKTYVNSLVSIMPALAAMIATICGALPTVIATLRSLDKKWKNGNGNGDIPLTPPPPIETPPVTPPKVA